ncbi:MAG: DUF3084 domain-containing protein [Trueperaceae bacterium]|nr:DUF3084 domain-containing protein [Trueperaceae bacterium]
MFLTVLVIAVLALLAGVIAYTGDVLGTVVGKRRLSLFGVRPKLTGRIIGVGAGVLIMITTATVLTLIFNRSIDVVQQYQNFLIQNRELEVSNRQLQRQIDNLTGQLELQREELAKIQSEADKLQVDNTQLQDLNTSLSNLNDQLASDMANTQDQLASQQNAALSLQNLLEDRAQLLADLQEQYRALEAGELTYTEGQVIHSAVISAQDEVTIREALAQFLQNAQNKVTLRGAVRIEPLSPDDTEFLIAAMRDTPTSDILIFSSPNNQFRASEVAYNIDLRENTQILTKGQLLISQQIHLGSSQLPVTREDLTSALARLSSAARERLLRLNMVGDVSLETTGLSPDAFAEQLLRLKGPVTIGMLASQDIYVAGPAQLEFVILY